MAKKKVDKRIFFQVGTWLGFIFLGYLGIRGYKNSVEQLKINGCIEEIIELSGNIQYYYKSEHNYGNLNYNTAVNFKIIPQKMFRKGFSEATNSYFGGIDFWYSPISEKNENSAFEISFQKISSQACKSLIKMNWGSSSSENLIAVGGYNRPLPAGQLDMVYPETEQKDIKSKNIFKPSYALNPPTDQLDNICNCKGYECTVVWKFR